MLYPAALTEAKAAGAAAPEGEAWGWLPPSLVHEGRRVQPGWLHDYLAAPRRVRPAAMLRMPQFHFLPGEVDRLVDYFAAASNAEFPYTANPSLAGLPARAEDPARWDRLDHALRMVRDRTTYCAKCHVIGEDRPAGQAGTTLAPDLEQVAERIRPGYLRQWLANPRSMLPYTPMPVNFPPQGPPLGQDLYPGRSIEQLDGVMDLLLHYPAYMMRHAHAPGDRLY